MNIRSVQSPSVDPLVRMKNITVNLYWIRHAYSCANILGKKGVVASALKSVVTIDPALSTEGVQQAKDLNTALQTDIFLKNPDIVLSSNLRRAMETAMYAFNDIVDSSNLVPIYIVPHISEARHPLASSFNIDKENAPLPASELKKTFNNLKTDTTQKLNTNVKFDLIDELDPNSKLGPDYEKFIKDVLPKILDLLSANVQSEKEVYNIAIVSHSHFITQHILATDQQKRQIANTEIWQETLSLTVRSVSVLDKYHHLKPKDCPTNGEIFCQRYEGKIASGSVDDIRCKKEQDSKAYSFAFGKDKKKPTIKGGESDYDKYVRYKTAYLESK